mmetsp:Transcript_126064/g.318093  ORF Transcript_126064/g.318093 Transcript_126064/m.318093 type:complete len:80 (+) Transcript_126064:889-1128(+)
MGGIAWPVNILVADLRRRKSSRSHLGAQVHTDSSFPYSRPLTSGPLYPPAQKHNWEASGCRDNVPSLQFLHVRSTSSVV